jgi:hypothetical protein
MTREGWNMVWDRGVLGGTSISGMDAEVLGDYRQLFETEEVIR